MILWLIVGIYTFSLLYIFLFSLGQLHLSWIYVRTPQKGNTDVVEYFPYVTVQLPIFNEQYVVVRLLNAICRLDYPKDKLEIQILDDSNDETSALLKEKFAGLSRAGFDVKYIHRENRTAFKAGALDNGLKISRGELIAIFDADFIPHPDFLRKTVGHFKNPDIGMVQTRWTHVNQDFSFLTQLQAFGLDAHFSVEQSARNAANSFINFNGTGGVWRKKCIEDAGGWSADTLTEDLDLSYRAQLTGWKFKYLETVDAPGELPIIMPAIKSQQYRWNKGGAETARKLFGRILSSDLGLINKAHAFFHLFNSSVFVFLFVAGILSVPMLYIKHELPSIAWLFDLGTIFLIGFFSITFFYWTATKRFYDRPVKSFWRLYPPFLIVSMGLSLHNSIAVAEGWLGLRSGFIRTPKFNVVKSGDPWKGNKYITFKINPAMVLEGLLSLYFIFGVVVGVLVEDPTLMFFHVMMAVGFGAVFFYSVKPALDA